MGLRTLSFVFGVATALSAQFAVALGLGEIRLNSTLNQPLDAEIQLLQVRDLSEREILVGLASLDDFKRVGVDRPFFLSDLKFSVDLNTDKGPVVRVRSEKPVREPFLNFVVQAQWPSGKLLREYTLLMDLPVFDERAAEPVTPAQEELASTTGQPARARQTPEQRREPKPVADERLSGRTGAGERVYGPVNSGDTLWAIAAATRPDRSVSVQQSMLAIQRANPGAFIDDNINLLRKGQVLRIPSREEMAEMTARDAITEVAYQNQRWSDRRTQAPAERAQLEGSRSYSRPSGETSGGEGRVKLTSPDETSDSSEGRGTGAGSGSTAALENELAVTLEQLDASKSENAELKSRIEAMEEQIETLERLVTLSNEQMRALELATQDTTEEAAEGEGAADSQQPDQQAPAPTAKDDAETDEAPAAEQNAVEQPAQQEPTAPAPPVRSRPAPEPTLLDRVLDNILYIALGFVALLGAAALYMRQRKNKSNDDEFEDFMVESDEDDLDAIGHFEEEEADYEPLENLEPEDNEIEGVLPLSDSEEDEDHAEQETEDAVAEAEIYIALAKYDQAEDILARALAKEPQDVNIRLKLLEIYSSLEDLDKFDEHFAILRTTDDNDAIEHATELRSRISGAPEFDHSGVDARRSAANRDTDSGARTSTSNSTEMEDLAFDIDPDFGAFEEDTPTEIRQDDVKKSADSEDFGDFDDLTLDLDDELAESDTASQSAASSASSDDDLNFDFDLDMDDMAEETTEATTDAGEIDLSDDFALELDDDELTTEPGQASELTMLDEDDQAKTTDDGATASNELALDSDELDLDLDFDLEADEDKTATNEEPLEMDSDLDFSLDDELDVTTAKASDSPVSEAPQSEAEDDLDTEFNFDDLDFDGLDTDSSETSASDDDLENLDDLGESISTESLRADLSGDDSDEDELDLDSEMDLSALDEELDAMAFELDDMGAPSAPEEPSEGEQPSAGEDFAFEEEPSADQEPLAYEEPSADKEPSANKEPSAYKEPAPKTEIPEQAPEAERPLSFGNRTYADLEEANEELRTIDPEADDDSDLGFLNDSDETATKLDLARAYIDMGDADGAKDILDEIMLEGNDEQRQEARKLLERIV